jgi:hypothetical protein
MGREFARGRSAVPGISIDGIVFAILRFDRSDASNRGPGFEHDNRLDSDVTRA